jgi:hypothetical protein
MLVWPVVIVGLIAVVTLLLQGCSEQEVMVSKSDLPALHEITADDLEEVEVSARTVGDSQWTESGDLVGRVTKTAIAKATLVRKADVTAAKPKSYGNRKPVGFHADSNTAGDVSTGNKVRLLFAPTADAESVKPLAVDAVLLSTSEPKSGGTDYVVAVSESDRTKMLDVVARARLLVVPAP